MSLLSNAVMPHETVAPVSLFSYNEVIRGPQHTPPLALEIEEAHTELEDRASFSAEELEHLLSSARAESAAEVERRLSSETNAKQMKQRAQLLEAVEAFHTERKQYFARIEAEVIQLSLAIAAKILHREAQADPMLVAAMVRIALDKLQDSSTVVVRVPSTEVERWQQHMGSLPHGLSAEIVGDKQLTSGACVLQTNLGAVDFGIDAQLKEVEQGFFDLLAQRPAV